MTLTVDQRHSFWRFTRKQITQTEWNAEMIWKFRTNLLSITDLIASSANFPLSSYILNGKDEIFLFDHIQPNSTINRIIIPVWIAKLLVISVENPSFMHRIQSIQDHVVVRRIIGCSRYNKSFINFHETQMQSVFCSHFQKVFESIDHHNRKSLGLDQRKIYYQMKWIITSGRSPLQRLDRHNVRICAVFSNGAQIHLYIRKKNTKSWELSRFVRDEKDLCTLWSNRNGNKWSIFCDIQSKPAILNVDRLFQWTMNYVPAIRIQFPWFD